jgi:hypothetical protein
LNAAHQSRELCIFFKENDLFVTLFLEMLALEAEEHLAPPLGPEQMYAACRHQINILKFKNKTKDRKLLKKVTCTI